jgi:antirestriction protein ArdC
MAKIDIYQAVTDRILETLDKGTVPWRHPIKRSGDNDGLPRSMSSKKPYRGVNIFLLAMTAWAKGYESAYWLTYKQAKQRGGQVRKGEKASLVVFWKRYATKDKETGDKKIVPVIRHYNVFNAEQVEGIEAPDAVQPDPDAEPFVPIDEAERIVAGYAGGGGPTVEHGGGQAYYRPKEDLVRIAEPERFVDRESYYATLFHELAHSTGHSKRLDRGLDKQLAPFGSADYSKEELTAEMGAAFLAAAAGISPPTIDQSAAYIDGWRKKLKGDKKLIVQAAGAGQRAADHVLGVSFGDTEPEAGSAPTASGGGGPS